MTWAEEFEELRPLLFSIAYRILGSASEAEDAVQEAFSMAVSRSSIRTSSACIMFLLIPLPLTLFLSDISPGDGPARIFRSTGQRPFLHHQPHRPPFRATLQKNRQPPTTRMAKQRPRLSHSHRHE